MLNNLFSVDYVLNKACNLLIIFHIKMKCCYNVGLFIEKYFYKAIDLKELYLIPAAPNTTNIMMNKNILYPLVLINYICQYDEIFPLEEEKPKIFQTVFFWRSEQEKSQYQISYFE